MLEMAKLAPILTKISKDVRMGGHDGSGSYDGKLHETLPFDPEDGMGPKSITLIPEMAKHNSRVIEWFRIDDIQLIEVDASAAHVAVVVTGKRRNQSPERWGGTITLEKRAGMWKIVTMPLTKQ
jgi:hypothetical protein